MMGWAGHVARSGVKRNACKNFAARKESEGKRLIPKPNPRWEDNIKIDI
jgi:hypothetical protein